MINLLNFQKTAAVYVAVFLFLGLSAQERNFGFAFQNDPQTEDFGAISIAVSPELSIQLAGLRSVEFKEFFRVYVGEEIPEDKSIPSISGRYAVHNESVVFRPRFDPPPGISYTAIFDFRQAYERARKELPADFPKQIRETLKVPKLKPISQEAIAAIYPTADTLPANWLRLYVYFEQPMGLDNPHDHVWLQDETGQIISTPFVEITEGLWNTNRTRLTLFFHPGRVKRGVGPNMTIGTVLQPGRHFQLTFDPEWEDALGRPIQSKKTKTFFVAEDDRKMIDPEGWIIRTPQPGTMDALEINWPEPLDHALARRMIRIVFKEEEIASIPELFDEETQLKLIPATTWRSGKYFIEVDPLLEDLAGNTALHLFDTATGEGSDPAPEEAGPIRIPFVIN